MTKNLRVVTKQVNNKARTLAVWLVPIFFSLYFIGGVIPPIFFNGDLSSTGEIIHKCYGFICHQIEDRSFYYQSTQFNFCARCVGLYGAIAFSTIYLAIRKRKQGMSVYFALFSIMPLLLDVMFHISNYHSDPNILRLSIGMIAGFGVTNYIYPRYLKLALR